MKAKASSRKSRFVEVLLLGVAFLSLLGTSLYFLLRPKGEATYADVLRKGELVYRLSLEEERELHLDVDHGTMVISVKDKAIAVLSSPCLHRYCVSQGYKSKAGESILCAPEGVAIYLRSEAEVTEVDL